MDLVEAKEQLKTIENESFGYCPVIRDECKVTCVCYRIARLGGTEEKPFIRYPTCTNMLITGVVKVNSNVDYY